MKRFLSLLFLGFSMSGLLMACAGNNNSQSIPIAAPYGTTCIVGQPCATGVATGYGYGTSGYVQYAGELSNINSGTVRSIVSSLTGVTTYCLGCTDISTVQIMLTPGTSYGQATIMLNNQVNLTGAVNVIPQGNAWDIQILNAAPGTFDIITTLPPNGSTTLIPSAVVKYNGTQFATVSLEL